jgi:hypothetical protein
MTTPVSFGPLVGSSISRTPSPNVCVGKGKGCAAPLLPQGEGSSLCWDKREQPPHMASANEEWAQLQEDLETWSDFAVQNKAEVDQARWDMDRLNSRVVNSYHHTSDILDMVKCMQNTVEQ